jgi:hemerythrin
MAAVTRWSSKYSVGVPELDFQHQRLFRLIYELRTGIATLHGQEVVGIVLNKLVNYTIYHFATEEELMQQCGFPDLATHRIEHNALTLKISEMQEEYRRGMPDAADNCLRYLEMWLEEHVQESDQEYVPFLSKIIVEDT